MSFMSHYKYLEMFMYAGFTVCGYMLVYIYYNDSISVCGYVHL